MNAAQARQACIAAYDYSVGDIVWSIYGERPVIKVNAKSVLLEGALGPIKICKSLIRPAGTPVY
jgi:hypothetical protein